jgi:hypothetical protein
MKARIGRRSRVTCRRSLLSKCSNGNSGCRWSFSTAPPARLAGRSKDISLVDIQEEAVLNSLIAEKRKTDRQ